MKIINLCDIKKGNIGYRIDRFPDGEPQIVITDEIDRKETFSVVCRVTSPEDLFILMELGDILDRNCVQWDLNIKYLMGMRMDRVMDFNRPFSLRIVGKMISSLGYDRCFINTPHSNRTIIEIRNSIEVEYMNPITLVELCNFDKNRTTIVFPDKGAVDRYKSTIEKINELENHKTENGLSFIFFDKKRDLETGKILSFDIHDENIVENQNDNNNIYDHNFLFFDDLCDAGGTFVSEVNILKQKYPNSSFSIYVTHLVNEKGLDNLYNNFDNVFTTNTYKDWEQVSNEKNYNINFV